MTAILAFLIGSVIGGIVGFLMAAVFALEREHHEI